MPLKPKPKPKCAVTVSLMWETLANDLILAGRAPRTAKHRGRDVESTFLKLEFFLD